MHSALGVAGGPAGADGGVDLAAVIVALQVLSDRVDLLDVVVVGVVGLLGLRPRLNLGEVELTILVEGVGHVAVEGLGEDHVDIGRDLTSLHLGGPHLEGLGLLGLGGGEGAHDGGSDASESEEFHGLVLGFLFNYNFEMNELLSSFEIRKINLKDRLSSELLFG